MQDAEIIHRRRRALRLVLLPYVGILLLALIVADMSMCLRRSAQLRSAAMDAAYAGLAELTRRNAPQEAVEATAKRVAKEKLGADVTADVVVEINRQDRSVAVTISGRGIACLGQLLGLTGGANAVREVAAHRRSTARGRPSGSMCIFPFNYVC